jgi:hypothetical protein
MSGFLEWIWQRFGPDRGWLEVRHSIAHPELGEMQFRGRRSRRDGRLHGIWYVKPPGYASEVSLDFPDVAAGETPAATDLALAARLLGDPDALFERSRVEMAAAYERTVEAPMPNARQDVVRLDSISLPSVDDPEGEWNVGWWCEAAEHWLVAYFRGDAVIGVELEG